jgi:hypothetical protein
MMTWADGQGPLPDPIPADQLLKRHPRLPEPAAPTSNTVVTYVPAMAEAAAFYDRWGDPRSAGDAYPETPRAFLTASPIGTNGFSSGEAALNIRL